MRAPAPPLASVNLGLDLGHPSRFAHFRPTRRACEMVSAIVDGAGSRSTLFIAPYGSGKSLSAGVALTLVENAPSSRDVLSGIGRRVGEVDRKAARRLRERVSAKARGLPLALEGHQPDLPRALVAQARARLGARSAKGAPDVIGALESVAAAARRRRMDRVAIVWDEFGAHLEALAAGGQAGLLADVQRMAEWAARQPDPVVTLSLMLHKGFLRHASRLGQEAQASWRKIEGRFRTVNHIEDGRESAGLVAALAEQTRSGAGLNSPVDFSGMAGEARRLGLFPEFGDDEGLARVIRQAHPLHPAALHALPLLASRLAQNERTALTFVRGMDRSRPQTLEDLYRHFSGVMEGDVGIGGVRRRWLEAQGALSRAAGDTERAAVCASAILGLGASGERVRVPRRLLEFAVRVPGRTTKGGASRAIDALARRGVLLHRGRTDDVSVWHGADVDVHGRLAGEMLRIGGRADLVGALSEGHPPPSWRPVRHNVTRMIRRHYEGAYVQAAGLLRSGGEHPLLRLDAGTDGRVVHCLAETADEVSALVRFAHAPRRFRKGDGVVLAIPAVPLEVGEMVRETLALRAMLEDGELVASDPFVAPELREMLASAQEALARRLECFSRPGLGQASWHAEGRRLPVRDAADLQEELSGLADRRFGYTAVLGNEMVCRRRVSRQAANVRRSLVMSVLEHSDRPHLGIDREGTSPVASLYRTLLLNTGLHDGRRWASPGGRLRGCDGGLGMVWEKARAFFSEPGEDKRPGEFFAALQSPPHGVRAGVLPVLFAAGLDAFAKAVAIRKEGAYLPDILPSTVDEICERPGSFTMDVHPLTRARKTYLEGLTGLFGGAPSRGDLLRQFHDALENWRAKISPVAFTTRELGDDALALRSMLRWGGGGQQTDRLALREFPRLAGRPSGDHKTLDFLAPLVREIEGVADRHAATAISVVHDRLAIDGDSPDDSLSRAGAWARAIGSSGLDPSRIGTVARAVLARAADADGGQYTESSFALALGAILLERAPDHWDERSLRRFDGRLRLAAAEIEQAALDSPSPGPSLAPLIRARIRSLRGKLAEAEGKAPARRDGR